MTAIGDPFEGEIRLTGTILSARRPGSTGVRNCLGILFLPEHSSYTICRQPKLKGVKGKGNYCCETKNPVMERGEDDPDS